MAAGVRVGNALGAGNAKAAKNTVKVALTIIGNKGNLFTLTNYIELLFCFK